MAAIGEAFETLSKKGGLSNSDIQSLRKNICLVVNKEKGGDRFSRDSNFIVQAESLAVETESTPEPQGDSELPFGQGFEVGPMESVH